VCVCVCVCCSTLSNIIQCHAVLFCYISLVLSGWFLLHPVRRHKNKTNVNIVLGTKWKKGLLLHYTICILYILSLILCLYLNSWWIVIVILFSLWCWWSCRTNDKRYTKWRWGGGGGISCRVLSCIRLASFRRMCLWLEATTSCWYFIYICHCLLFMCVVHGMAWHDMVFDL